MLDDNDDDDDDIDNGGLARLRDRLLSSHQCVTLKSLTLVCEPAAHDVSHLCEAVSGWR
jgi:hypothetical protein